MNFKIAKQVFLDAINIGASMSGKSKVLPMHNQAKITIKDKCMTISSYDGEVAVTKRTTGVVSDGDAVFCVEPKDIVSFVKTLRDEVLSFDVREKVIYISHKKGTAEFVAYSADEFATPIIEEDTTEFVVNSKTLFDYAKIAKDFTSTDSLRPILNGILMYVENGSFGITGTDGIKLFNDYCDHEYYNEKKDAILSCKAVDAMLSMINGYESVKVAIGERNVIITVDDAKLVARKIEGRYPNFKAVIPNNHTTQLTVNKGDLNDSMSRAIITTNKANFRVKLDKAPMALVIESQDYDFGKKSQETCMCDSDSTLFTIGTSGGNLLTAIKSIESEDIEFRFIEPNKPIILKDSLNKNRTVLIMPMTLD